jgi:hypothetical protein
MNKTWMIVIAGVAVVALILSAFGVFFLFRSNNNLAAVGGAGVFGRGWSSDQDGRGAGGMMNGKRGMMNGTDNRVDMQTYYQTAVAEQLGMTASDLQTKQQAGTSLLTIAAEKDLSVKEYNTMLETARTNAVDKALADGVISQNQADQMKSATDNNGWFGKGMGFGWCY